MNFVSHHTYLFVSVSAPTEEESLFLSRYWSELARSGREVVKEFRLSAPTELLLRELELKDRFRTSSELPKLSADMVLIIALRRIKLLRPEETSLNLRVLFPGRGFPTPLPSTVILRFFPFDCFPPRICFRLCWKLSLFASSCNFLVLNLLALISLIFVTRSCCVNDRSFQHALISSVISSSVESLRLALFLTAVVAAAFREESSLSSSLLLSSLDEPLSSEELVEPL
mmetsp:Transcript_3651/g.6090  ORF Transcript_3651/g.6090 Transcript_3651/m.6090 type:complete len:228 (-) Transcript_3651:2787-3470(-)